MNLVGTCTPAGWESPLKIFSVSWCHLNSYVFCGWSNALIGYFVAASFFFGYGDVEGKNLKGCKLLST